MSAQGTPTPRQAPHPALVALVTVVVLVVVVLAGAAVLVGTSTGQGLTLSAPQAWNGPVRGPLWAPVQPPAPDADGNPVWTDARDAPLDWLDVARVSQAGDGQPHWTLELAGRPPPAAGLDGAEMVISYGLVFETTGDGRADYLVGINNDAPVQGDFRVWVTDLATGKTEEQVGGPYGFPIEFRHPDEARPDDPPTSSRTMTFTFLSGSAPPGLDGRSPFYAWSALTRHGETVAWDFAPDAAWFSLEGPP
jgi:hypothetical protein